jgi:hypothetical protein
MCKAVNPFTKRAERCYPLYQPFGEGVIPKVGEVYKDSCGSTFIVHVGEHEGYVHLKRNSFIFEDSRYVLHKDSIRDEHYTLIEPKQYLTKFFKLLGAIV